MDIVNSHQLPTVRAAETFSLSCQASGGTGMFSYQWSSTCTGNCLLSVNNVAAQTITRDAARSADSGIYTCTVVDNVGNYGSNSIEIEVVGKIMIFFAFFYCPCLVWQLTGAGFFISGIGTAYNNSILEVSSEGRIPQLYCLSGFNMSIEGDWISPEGRDLVAVLNDPFDVIIGSSNDPGQLLIETPLSNPHISPADEGVYTCVIPNEDGESEYLHIGLYHSTSKSLEHILL